MSKKKSLHVMVDTEVYEKLRHVCFYEGLTLAGILRGLLDQFLEQKALREPGICAPRQL